MAKTLSDGSVIDAGDLAWVSLDPTKGAEKRKTRPCLIVEAGASPLDLAIVLPITDGNFKTTKVFVQITNWQALGLQKPSVIDCYQIRAVSLQRLSKKFGTVDDDVMDEVKGRLAMFLDIGEQHVT
jgi:mRNA interferase MazF